MREHRRDRNERNFKKWTVHLGSVGFNKKTAQQFMLEFWFKEKRTLVDFRRGVLGPHFGSFAAQPQMQEFRDAAQRVVVVDLALMGFWV